MILVLVVQVKNTKSATVNKIKIKKVRWVHSTPDIGCVLVRVITSSRNVGSNHGSSGYR